MRRVSMFQRGESKDGFHSSTRASLCFFPPFLPTGVGGGGQWGRLLPSGPFPVLDWESHSSAFHGSSGLTAALDHWSCWFLSTWSGAAVDAFIFVSVLFSVVQVGKLGIIFNSSLSHTPPNQSIKKSCWLYLLNITQIQSLPLLLPSPSHCHLSLELSEKLPSWIPGFCSFHSILNPATSQIMSLQRLPV